MRQSMRFAFPTAAATCLLAATSALADSVITSFEFTDLTGRFTLGESPDSVTFLNGEAKTVGIFDLYRTGKNAWMIPGIQTGTIEFETPAATLELFFRDQVDATDSVLTVFDDKGGVIQTFNGSHTAWTTVAFTDASIGSITLQNNGVDGYTVIDDFTSCSDSGAGGMGLEDPIPESITPGVNTAYLKPIATGLTAPNWGAPIPTAGKKGNNRLIVTDQPGILWAIDLATGDKTVFLDVSELLVTLGIFGDGSFDERGLLGVAIHPDYLQNGLLYTYTSQPRSGLADFSTMPKGTEGNHDAVITEWQVREPADPKSVVDPKSARELFRVEEPQFNHNAGAIMFGPDGFLYIALGDGGGADDVDGQEFIGEIIIGHGDGNGQDPTNPLGAVLRIDPQGDDSANGQYGIPKSNPFMDPKFPKENVDEIYLYGLRNPFRMSFDTATGDLYIADVGQNDIEEIDIAVLGGNFGWNLKEGSFFFDPNGNEPGFVTDEDPGVPKGLVDPIAEYDHDEGIAVVGGFVYRGTTSPRLVGRYVFGDFSRTFLGNDGRLFFLNQNLVIREFRYLGRPDFDLSLLGFGQDADGEVYVMANMTGVPFGDTGAVYQVLAGRAATLDDVKVVRGSLVKGGVAELLESDDSVMQTRSVFGFTALEPNVMEMRLAITAQNANHQAIDLAIESRIDHPIGVSKVKLMNFKTGQFESVASFDVTMAESSVVTDSIDATNRIRPGDARVSLSITHVVVATFSAAGFNSFFDEVAMVTR